MKQGASWYKLQDMVSDEALYNLLLASAAIPLAFPSRTLGNTHYVDGGLGDNVPLKALSEVGCSHAIVVHLQNASVWNRHDYSGVEIIEIRPIMPLKSSASFLEMLDFNPNRINNLQEIGYESAKKIISEIMSTTRLFQALRDTNKKLLNSTVDLLEDPPLDGHG